MSKPLISVCVITYNQVDFIGKALQGVLEQQRDSFNLEIVVGDDCSTDGTDSVIEKFFEKHPDLIKFNRRQENLGMHGNWAKSISDCKGDFIAILEGDDYWCDNHKLEKQLERLKTSPNASLCFTNARVLLPDGKFHPYDYVDKEGRNHTTASFLALNFNPIPTCSILFRKTAFDGFPPPYYQSPFADWVLHSILIQNGEFLYLDSPTCVYRQHAGGVWSGIESEKQLTNKLKALHIIKNLVQEELRGFVSGAIRNQLDDLLYFYRERKNHWNYFLTWVNLKTS